MPICIEKNLKTLYYIPYKGRRATKKRIKIFAAFDKDVEEDMVRFGDFLCGFNAQCTGIEFSVFKSEKELCESLEQPEEQIDAELETYEYFLLILGGETDEFALDKLNRAKDLKFKLIKLLFPRLRACGVAVTETEKFIQISLINILRKAG